MQPFYLGSGTDKPTIGGDDVEHNAAYICEASGSMWLFITA
jgi:hypothetical protein